MVKHALFPSVVGGLLLFACTGGPADPSTSSTSSSGSSGASSSSTSSGGASGANPNKPDEPPSQGCTAIACVNGLTIQFSIRTPGEYAFDVVLDGATTKCTAKLPLSSNPPQACDNPNILLGLSGSALPANQHSLENIMILSTNAESVTVKGTRDGASIGEKTFKPNWKTTPGPNGPNCEPKECKSATETFP
jgi:hypothetical protein